MAAVRLRPEAFRPAPERAGDPRRRDPPRRAARRGARGVHEPAASRRSAAASTAADYIVESRTSPRSSTSAAQKEDFVAVEERVARDPPRRDGRHRRRVGLGQDHDGAHAAEGDRADERRASCSTARTSPGLDRAGSCATFRQRVQPIFQDPYSSLNPMFTIERIIEEPLAFYKRGSSKERAARVRRADGRRRPARSRCCGATRPSSPAASGSASRSPARWPSRPSSSCATSRSRRSTCSCRTRSSRLLGDLQREYGLSYLFISHDLAVVRLISDYVCVMKDGELVEAATSEEIFTNPRDPYTRGLLASIPGNELDIAV